jgi:Arc/MetJ-type ribon-helix-helix transcriptional regulator
MATVTIRTDDEVERALQALTRSGRSRSEVVREAILAADREARRAQMRAEAEALRDDPTEIAAMKRLAADMESIRAW